MRDILKEKYLSVWNGTNKVNENKNGGVALWSLPPLVYNAHNPAMFTREKYLHVTDGYVSPFEKQPCYVSIDNVAVKLVFSTKTASNLYVTATTNEGQVIVKVMKGVTEWAMSNYCSKILAVTALDMDTNWVGSVPEDGKCIYLKPDEAYVGELYICKDKDNIIYRNMAIDSCALTFYFDDETKVTLSAESFEGKTVFNAGEVVKPRFAKNLAEFGSRLIVEDPALSISHTVSAKVASETFVAVNGVSQIGKSSARLGETGALLSTLEHLTYYEGYPFDYTIMAAEDDWQTVHGTAYSGGIARVLLTSGMQKVLANENREDVLIKKDNQVLLGFYVDRRIYRSCIPDNPFYVRWLNHLGGVDYFMFGKTQKKTRSIKSVSSFNPFIDNTETAKTNRQVYSMSTESSVVAGTSLLGRKDYEAVSLIPFSPIIEWYNEETGKWVRLTVEKFDGNTDTRGEMSSAEITFTMPTINVQY
jgi:hypothetical protein